MRDSLNEKPPNTSLTPQHFGRNQALIRVNSVRFFFPASYDILYNDPFMAKGCGNTGSSYTI